MSSDWMTLAQAANALGVRTATLRAQIARGQMRAERRGRDWLVTVDEVARYRRDVSGRRGRKSSALLATLGLVAAVFERDGQWPRRDLVQRQLVLSGLDVDLAQLAHSLDPSLGRIEAGGLVILTVRGLARAGSVEPIADFEAAMRLAISRYRDPAVESPAISSDDFATMGFSALRLERLRILVTSAALIVGSGGGNDDGWSYAVSDEIHRLGKATTIADYLGALDRLAAPRALLDIGPAGSWVELEARLQDLGELLRRARSNDDYQDVGRRSREIIKDLAGLLSGPTPGSVPGGGNPMSTIELFLDFRLGAGSLADLRATLRGANRLANHVTHDPQVLRAETVAAAHATVLMVRAIGVIAEAAYRT